ncbi:MAG: aminotransferase class I/II-fold pyridoxal phosphate-dependent enzyme [Pseudomonadales bacterium]
MSSIKAPQLVQQPVSVTRKMSASLPQLRATAQRKGLKMHHLGAGYPHPEVTDPRGFLAHEQRYYQHLAAAEGLNDPEQLPEYLRESFSYTDTLGPVSTRRTFAGVYGHDLGLEIDPDQLLPTVGATGGISLSLSVFERAGVPLAFITDAPTYAGFVARASLTQSSAIYSVPMDDEGPDPQALAAQIDAARAAGYFVPFYYTVPDGHNPAGFSFSAARRRAIVEVVQAAGILILEDAPYFYINYAPAAERPPAFVSLAPQSTVHLFTGSKIGFPGPRVGFLYSDATVSIRDAESVPFTTLALTEAAGDILFHNPAALHGFDALLHDEHFAPRQTLWDVAEQKLAVYRENRQIMLEGLEQGLGAYPERFRWTHPAAGFFVVFSVLDGSLRTDEDFVSRLVSDYGVVAIPMYDFYPEDARSRDPNAGLNELRLSFCFNESQGEGRRRDLAEGVAAFCAAILKEAGS